MRRLALALLMLFAVPAAAQTSPPPPTAEERTEALLAAMGGRAAWAAVRGLSVAAQHYEAQRPGPYANRLWIDFDRFRVAFEAKGAGLDRRRVVTDTTGVSLREGVRTEMTAAAVAEDRAWWDAHIYRTVHRLAARAPGIATRLEADGRLTVVEGDKPLMTITQNVAGEPVAFGATATGTVTVFGPLVAFPQAAGVRVPAFSVRPNGSWRAILTAVVANPPLDGATFATP
jgi:hypothetical protein